ncbi:hypothetical protein GCM10010326_01780 [Streptomyces xanthochromogenes]|uniref:Uncharacterized protein n=1 Tax=Streptomyces xanthochromogenes TaxID=67384 RepID=A0ABQ2ZE95_9ACTN|nr:hypothetical protein GCM10010326_01780 [Streptomyces xanthochromogenes]
MGAGFHALGEVAAEWQVARVVRGRNRWAGRVVVGEGLVQFVDGGVGAGGQSGEGADLCGRAVGIRLSLVPGW